MICFPEPPQGALGRTGVSRTFGRSRAKDGVAVARLARQAHCRAIRLRRAFRSVCFLESLNLFNDPARSATLNGSTSSTSNSGRLRSPKETFPIV